MMANEIAEEIGKKDLTGKKETLTWKKKSRMKMHKIEF